MDSDNHPITLCLLCSQSPPKDYNVLRTFHSPSESISPMGFGFCSVVQAQLSNPLRVLSKTQPRLKLWGVGYWVWAIGYGLLAIGDGLLGIGYGLRAIGYGLWAGVCSFADICVFTLYALRFTLKATATTPLTFRLITSSPLTSNLILCQRLCFDADATGRCRSDTK